MSGPLELAMSRRGGALTPTSPAFLDDLETIPEGKEVIVTVRMARNPRQDRWFHAMIGEVVRSGVWEGTAESFRRSLKIALGYAEEVIGADGKVYYVLQSLSPASMDGLAFREFIKRVEHHLAERYGVDIAKFRSAVRSRAGADAEPKEPAEADPADTAGADDRRQEPQAAPAAGVDKSLLWDLSAALGKASTKPAIIQAAEAFKSSNRQLDSAAYRDLARAVCKLHIIHRLEPQFLPFERLEREMVDLIDNGIFPKWLT